jgi:hypothetical protein
VVPHVAAREAHQRSLEFSYFTRKRLLQQYRRKAVVRLKVLGRRFFRNADLIAF